MFQSSQVYVAPTKALIQEKMREWQEKFGSKSVGLTCQELTSDSDALPVKELQETDLILTTPEVLYKIVDRICTSCTLFMLDMLFDPRIIYFYFS